MSEKSDEKKGPQPHNLYEVEMNVSDPTENIRRQMVQEINTVPDGREYLEAKYGQVWDTNQLTEEFEVVGFMAPFVAVKRKSDNQRGSLIFQHSPRFYFLFEPHNK